MLKNKAQIARESIKTTPEFPGPWTPAESEFGSALVMCARAHDLLRPLTENPGSAPQSVAVPGGFFAPPPHPIQLPLSQKGIFPPFFCVFCLFGFANQDVCEGLFVFCLSRLGSEPPFFFFFFFFFTSQHPPHLPRLGPPPPHTHTHIRNSGADIGHMFYVMHLQMAYSIRGGSRIFIWGGGGRKRLCARTHITSAEPNSLSAGVHGPAEGPWKLSGLF